MPSNTQPQRPNVGVVLLLIRDNTLLLQKRKGNDGLSGFYAPIAGKVDVFESPSQAIIREAQEEAGITVNRDDLTVACTLHWSNRAGQDVIEFYYIASRFQGELKILEPNRAELIDFFPLDALPEKTVTSIPKILKVIHNHVHYVEWNGMF